MSSVPVPMVDPGRVHAILALTGGAAIEIICVQTNSAIRLA